MSEATESPQASDIMEESYMEEGIADEAAIHNADAASKNSRLSMVSRMYDFDGDGQLDEAELAMRNMDKSGKGFLTNEKVFGLMQQHMQQQKQLFKFKKIMISLAALVFLLTLANLGTSFAAAYLAKDTTVNNKGALVNSNSKEKVSTQVTGDLFEVKRGATGEDGRRMLCEKSNKDICKTDSYLQMDLDTCNSVIDKCDNNNVVTLLRSFSTGETVKTTICHSETKVHRNLNKKKAGKVQLNNYGIKISIDFIEDNDDNFIGCMFRGDDLIQDEGEVCDVSGDCGRESKCGERNAVSIAGCNRECAVGRNNKARIRLCQEDCVSEPHNICQVIIPEPTLFPTYTSHPSLNPTATDEPTHPHVPSLSPTLSTAPSRSSQPSLSLCPALFKMNKQDYKQDTKVTIGDVVYKCKGIPCQSNWKKVGICNVADNTFVSLSCPAIIDLQSKAYVLGSKVTAGSNVYECSVAPCDKNWSPVGTCNVGDDEYSPFE